MAAAAVAQAAVAALRCGDEVDFNAAGAFWVPARVERFELEGGAAAAAAGGAAAVAAVVLRFAVGAKEVLHAVDVRRPAEARRIAAACEATASSSLLWRRPQITTCAPSFAKACAVARPMPSLPPVTQTIWPVRSKFMVYLSVLVNALDQT
jgi:hypothetical protein